MSANVHHRLLLLTWTTVLASPIAWGASLVSMFWLTHPVCQGLARPALVLTGCACALVTFVASVAAGRALKRFAHPADNADHAAKFLLELARWTGLIFMLVILLSLVPTALLTPCPV